MNAEFWSMGGYAFYVWGSYAAGLAVFVWNLVVPRLQRRDVLRKLRDAAGAVAEGA
jgi:heme exporter protein D